MRRRRPSVLAWASDYDPAHVRTDLVAGATVWAVLVPSALAYAAIVGVDPIVGLYTVPLALVGYALLGGSRLLVVGPDAAVSVLAAATIAPVVTGDDYLEVTLALSLIVGAVYVVLWALRMGWIADLVPDPVLKGFIQGLVWVTVLDQVPKLLGVGLEDPPDDFWRRAADTIRAIDEAHAETAILGLGCLAALFALKMLLPRAPGPLVVLAVSLVVVGVLGLDDDGVSVVGEPTGALFDVGLPSGVDSSQLLDLVPGALAIVVLGFTESMGAAKTAAQTTGERLDPDQELLAIGAANLGAGVSGGYVVTGALSKTSVAIASGGRSQLGNLAAAVLAVATILVLRPVFGQLADSVLAAIVAFAMVGMANWSYFRTLWHISRAEFLLALLAFLGVLTFGVLPGVVIGVVFSLVLLVQHIGDPPSRVLGRTPSGAWRDVERHPEAATVEGAIVWRQEAPLVFLNARRLSDRLRGLATEGVEVVVFDASAITGVDSTGLAAFRAAADSLATVGIDLWIVNPLVRSLEKARTRSALLGLDLPPLFDSIDEAIAAFEQRAGSDDHP